MAAALITLHSSQFSHNGLTEEEIGQNVNVDDTLKSETFMID